MIQHTNKGLLYEVALMIIWFCFAFIIIPIYIIKFLKKILPEWERRVKAKTEQLKRNMKR